MGCAGPRLLLPRLVLWTPFKVLVLLVFAGYLAVSVWGIMFHLEQGLRLKDLVLDNSYYYRWAVLVSVCLCLVLSSSLCLSFSLYVCMFCLSI